MDIIRRGDYFYHSENPKYPEVRMGLGIPWVWPPIPQGTLLPKTCVGTAEGTRTPREVGGAGRWKRGCGFGVWGPC